MVKSTSSRHKALAFHATSTNTAFNYYNCRTNSRRTSPPLSPPLIQREATTESKDLMPPPINHKSPSKMANFCRVEALLPLDTSFRSTLRDSDPLFWVDGDNSYIIGVVRVVGDGSTTPITVPANGATFSKSHDSSLSTDSSHSGSFQQQSGDSDTAHSIEKKPRKRSSTSSNQAKYSRKCHSPKSPVQSMDFSFFTSIHLCMRKEDCFDFERPVPNFSKSLNPFYGTLREYFAHNDALYFLCNIDELRRDSRNDYNLHGGFLRWNNERIRENQQASCARRDERVVSSKNDPLIWFSTPSIINDAEGLQHQPMNTAPSNFSSAPTGHLDTPLHTTTAKLPIVDAAVVAFPPVVPSRAAIQQQTQSPSKKSIPAAEETEDVSYLAYIERFYPDAVRKTLKKIHKEDGNMQE